MKQSTVLIRNKFVLLGIAAALVTAGVLSFSSVVEGPAHATAAIAAPATPVSVQTLTPETLRVWSSFSGRMQAVDAAAIRPEVSGRITQIRFKDGANVKAGDVLMVIDPQPYEAAAAKAEAHVASATSKAGFAKTELDRAETLVKSQAIAQRLYDERASDSKVAQADILSAEAELKQARIDLDHAYVKAPISGRVSRAEITLGNLVQTGPNAPVLTSIVSNDGIYADFEVDEQTYLRSIRSHAATQETEQAIPVELTVQGDEDHPYKGRIVSFDNHIDTGSGTIRARARFANEDGALVPGMFVSVRVASASEQSVLLVPERAIGTDQSKRFVFVVTPENKVAFREVVLGPDAREGQRIVLKGLKPGERVVVDGVQHIRPDTSVAPTELAADLSTTKAVKAPS
ncbi:MAG: efflux RND transporter periplasmic adaptor subunit [Burkholderiaceae bacterium]